MFEVDDKVKLKSDYNFLHIILSQDEYKIEEILQFHLNGKSTQWVKINNYNDWVDSSYLEKKNK